MFPRGTKRRGRLSNETGSSQIEFAVSIVLIVVLVLWIWELGMAVYTFSVLADAAKEGVRYAVVHGSNNANCSGPGSGLCATCPAGQTCATDATAQNVINVVTDYAKSSLHDVSALTACSGSVTTNCVSVSYLKDDGTAATDNSTPVRVVVTVSYNYVPYFTLPWAAPTLRTAAAGRIVN